MTEHVTLQVLDVIASEVTPGFFQKMSNAMSVSFHKYGPVKKGYQVERGVDGSVKGDVDAVRSLEKRLALYKETGNTEWLVDVANFAMIEFTFPRHPDAHYRPTDADESPGRTRIDGRDAGQRHNLDIEVKEARQ